MDGAMISCPSAATLRRLSGRKWSRYPADVLPAWIADMDFSPAPAVRSALAEAVELGDFGYGPPASESGVPEAFALRAMRRWRWDVDPGDVLLSPDVVCALANCIEALTEPGDAVLVQTPAYPPLTNSVRAGGRRLVEQPLGEGGLCVDALAETFRKENVRLMLLCHPHNPTGATFDSGSLSALAALAAERDVIIVSDEVHADLVYPPLRHAPFASVAGDAASRCVTLTSASKAYNIAGLRLAVCIAGDARLRGRLAALPATRWSAFSTLGVRATRAAWSEEGDMWLDACIDALGERRTQLAGMLEAGCPGVYWRPPDAGYLAWLDCRGLGLGADPAAFFLERARVALSSGPEFGRPGAGFARLNFATSASILDEIVSRMGRALASRPQADAQRSRRR